MTIHRTPPWKKPRPKSKSGVKLSAQSVAWAKARAKKGGRRYPNLVDNMAAVRRQMERKDKKLERRSRP